MTIFKEHIEDGMFQCKLCRRYRKEEMRSKKNKAMCRLCMGE